MARLTRVEWHGPERKKELETALAQRLARCAILVASTAKRLVSIAGTGQKAKGGGVEPASPGRKKRIYGAFPSAPGESPHKQTGRLRASITWEIAGKVARVGTNLLYGRWLELGTRKMKARPWLRKALAMCAAQIRAILSKPLN